MTKYTKEEMVQTFSDFYKEVNGFRPSPDHAFYSMDVESMNKEWDYLGEQLAENDRREAKMQDKAIKSFNDLIANLIKIGARGRAQAIEWLMDAEDFFDPYSHDTGDTLCYRYRLPYSYGKEFDQVIINRRKRRGV